MLPRVISEILVIWEYNNIKLAVAALVIRVARFETSILAILTLRTLVDLRGSDRETRTAISRSVYTSIKYSVVPADCRLFF